MSDSRVDVLREIRLRHWARTHYVPLSERKETWHPIVLDEMRCRDRELEELADLQMSGSRYVPLAPTNHHVLHPAHETLPDPKLLQRTAKSGRRKSESHR
jgi:hypothetical protein